MARLNKPPGVQERTVAQAVRDARTIIGAIRTAVAPTSTELELAGEDLEQLPEDSDLRRRRELGEHLFILDGVLKRAADRYGDRELERKSS